jgi:SAM-dependent methyltransferase
MEKLRRKEHWDRVYTQKPFNQTSWHQAIPRRSLLMIAQAASLTTAIIDIGAGASLLVDHLLDRGFRDLSVLDVSGAALKQARSRLGERSKRLNWIEADVLEFIPGRSFGLWHDRAAFHFLTSMEDQQKYVSVLNQALEPGGQAIIATFSPEGPAKCSGLDIVQYNDSKMERVLGKSFRLLENQAELHVTPAGNEQAFNYFRFQKS